MMKINNDKFSNIDNAFRRLKENVNDTEALDIISKNVSSLSDKNIIVKLIYPENKYQECIVMSVYPDENTLDAVIYAIVSESKTQLNKIWNSSKDWTVEIDTRILSNNIDLTERELTSLLLHELGHVIYSNTIPAKLDRIVKYKYATTGMVSKQLLKDNLFSKFLFFPILNACNMNRDKSSIKKEIQADRYSANSGYGDDLNSAIDKIIIYAGSSSKNDDDMDDLMGFSIDSITSLQNRQNHIVKRNINKVINSTPSVYTKKVLSPLVVGLHGSKNGSITEDAKDSYINSKIDKIVNDFYISETFLTRTKKMKRIDPADIDYIALEVNNIKSNDDKMMIISYIYNKLDIIDYYIALIDSKNPKYVIPHSRESLMQMRDRLEKYKQDAIDRKLPEIRYGIQIQYPEGYEG